MSPGADVEAFPKSCQWNGCRFKGKAQNTKSALMAHMRSHSGERSHWCKLPECDKVFTRADALHKHERSVHSSITTTNTSNTKSSASSARPESSPTKKRKTSPSDAAMGAGDSDLSDIDEPPAMNQDGGSAEARPASSEEEQQLDDAEVLAAVQAHPEDDPHLIRYIVMLAKYDHLQKERDALRSEKEEVQAQEAKLREQKDLLLNHICQKELSYVT